MALDVDTDRAFQERFWVIKRIGWLVMAAVIVAAVAGLTGAGGPLASATVKVGETEMTYPRVARWQTSADLSVKFPPGMQGTGEIVLPEEFINSFSVENITPEPIDAVVTPAGRTYRFAIEGSGAKTVDFVVRPKKPRIPTTVRSTNANAPRRMSFVILP